MNTLRLRRRFVIAMGLSASAVACSKDGARPEAVPSATPSASTSAIPIATASATASAAIDAAPPPPPPKPNFPTGGCGFDIVCTPFAKTKPSSPAAAPLEKCASEYTEPKPQGGGQPRTGGIYADVPAGAKTGDCCYKLMRQFCGGGRPLRGDDGPIVASVVSRGDWIARDVAALSATANDELAARWLREAAFEHASLASFARATLQLLALGARRGAGENGPGPLAVDRAPLATSFEAFVVDTFLDGCVAETVSGIEIRSRADDGDDVERRALAAIADDEERHTELAWRMLAWGVRAGGERARLALGDAIDRIDAREPIVRDVVLPCVRALFAAKVSADGNRIDRRA